MNSNVTYGFVYSIAWLVLLTGGCHSGGLEGTFPVRGEVTYNGQPLESGEVRYLPLDAKIGRVARGTITNGSFRLTTLKENDGALPGEYRIVVVVYEEQFDDISRRERDEEHTATSNSSKPPIPPKYYSPETSGLTDTVNDDHSGYIEFALVD